MIYSIRVQRKTGEWQTELTIRYGYGHHHPDYQREAAENIGRRPQIVRVIA